MTEDESKGEVTHVEREGRRAFVGTMAKGAMVAPTVTLLLDVTTKPADAQSVYQPLTPDVMVHPITG